MISPAFMVRMCAEAPSILSMRLKELKDELDKRGVTWRGIAFEKEELARLLVDARSRPPAPSAPPPTPQAPTSSPPPSSAAKAAQDAAWASRSSMGNVETMKVADIKAELKSLGVDTSALFEKTELVAALIKARASKPPKPPDDDVIEVETRTMPPKGASKSGMPGGMGGMGGMPGGMSGMGGLGDILSGLGGMGGMGGMPGGMGGMPGGMGGMPGGMGGMPGGMGGMPGGMGGMGGLGDILNGMGGMGGMPGGMGGMQQMMAKMMSNPRAMALMQKAQTNPKIMKALQDVQTNGPSAMQKYAGDPEVMAVVKELQEIMSS